MKKKIWMTVLIIMAALMVLGAKVAFEVSKEKKASNQISEEEKYQNSLSEYEYGDTFDIEDPSNYKDCTYISLSQYSYGMAEGKIKVELRYGEYQFRFVAPGNEKVNKNNKNQFGIAFENVHSIVNGEILLGQEYDCKIYYRYSSGSMFESECLYDVTIVLE